MFYDSISSVYDYIFPQNRKQLDLIYSIAPISENEKILDVGCATGNLSSLLSEKSKDITGVDLDKELLKIAKEKYVSITFIEEDMMNLSNHFTSGTFSRIVSFGNTLVHLKDRANVKQYLCNLYKLLEPGGIITFQIINYDRIIDNKITNLPTIDNNNVNFKRDYIIHKGYVDFNTTLKIKSNNQIIKNSIPLLSLRRVELEDYLTTAGFKEVKFYGDLKGSPLSPDSIPLIFSGRKSPEE